MTYQVGTLYTVVAKEPRGVGFKKNLYVLFLLHSLLHDFSSTQERLFTIIYTFLARLAR